MKNIGLSLDLVNLHYQEPNRNRFESRYFWEEFYTLVATAGFSGVEMPYEPYWMFGGRSGVPFTKYSISTKYKTAGAFLDQLRRCGIDRIVGIHFDPTLFMRGDLEAYFGAYAHFATEAVEYAAEVGAGHVTLTPTPGHGLLHHHFGKEKDWDAWTGRFVERTAELVDALGTRAKDNGVGLTVKNEYWSLLRGDRIGPFLQMLSSPVRMDIDTAHLQIAGLDPVAKIREYASIIGSVHLTDTNFTDDCGAWNDVNPEFPQRRATQVFRDIGQGAVDLPAACKALQSTGYDGWLICSCRQTRDPFRALLRTRRHIDSRILAES